MQLPNDLMSRLPELANSVALPAMIGAAGGGALSAYTSARSRPGNETPEMRRRRILRNALVGVLLGGTAGATLPTGIKMLGGQLAGSQRGLDPGASAIGFGLANAAPLAVGVGGGLKLRNLRQAEKTKAIQQILGQLGSKAQVGGANVRNEATLRKVLESGGRSKVLQALAREGKGYSPARLMKSHELLSEAGYTDDLLSQLLGSGAKGNVWGDIKTRGKLVDAIRSQLTESSMLPGKLKQFGPGGLAAKLLGKSVGGVSTTPLAEAYLNYVRPSMKRVIGRGGWGGRAALLGGGVYAAKTLQDALMGQN